MLDPKSSRSESVARPELLARAQRRTSRGAQRGATFTEALLAVALIALLAFGAFQALGAKVAAVARGQADAIASLRAKRSPSLPTLPPVARADGRRHSPAPPKKEGAASLWGSLADIAIDMSPIGDVKTLMDPNASVFDKVLAGVSLATTLVPGVGQAVRGASIAVKVAKAADRTAGAVDDVKDLDKAVHEAEQGADLVAAGKRGRKAEEEADSAEAPVWVQHPKDGSIREYPASDVRADATGGTRVDTPEGPGHVVSRGEPPNESDVRAPAPEKPPVPRTPSERARDVAQELREEIRATRDLNKPGRSGGAIGAQEDRRVGAELVRRSNQTSDKELAAELRKLGQRLTKKGGDDVHK
jgi:hypothetical protein